MLRRASGAMTWRWSQRRQAARPDGALAISPNRRCCLNCKLLTVQGDERDGRGQAAVKAAVK